MTATTSSAPDNAGAPANAQRVLITLVIVVVVANPLLVMANAALLSIGKFFNVSKVRLNLIAGA